jgi:hypothetical protein
MRRAVAAIVAAVVAGTGAWSAAEARFNRWPTVEPHYKTLNAIAMCESGMNWRIVSANGLYMGGLQFSAATWRSVGGRGLPHHHTRAEQRYRGALLLIRDGLGQWPVCGRRLLR